MIGPKNDLSVGEQCPGFTFPTHFIYRAAIFSENDRIVGVRLQSAIGVTDLGRVTKRTEVQYFEESSQLIGFYGT